MTLPERGKGYDLASRLLMPAILGSRPYRTKLTQASEELYHLLRRDAVVKANTGKPVMVKDKPRAILTGFSPRNREADLAILQHLLHSLSHIASHLSEGLTLIGIPLNQEGYKNTEAYGHLSLPAAQRAVYALHLFQLEDEPFLNIIPGTYDRTKGTGQVTRVKASRPALDWLIQNGLIFPGHPYYPDQIYSDEPVHLKLKPWKPTKTKPKKTKDQKLKSSQPGQPLGRPLQGTEMVLPISLQLLKKAKLSLPLPSYAFYEGHWDWSNKKSKLITKRNVALYRSFSGEDGRGGRIYGHWVQMLPSEARQHVTFHNQPSVELDYSSMQLALLYHLHNVPMPEGELYKIPGTPWPREACKAVLRISVGNSTRTKTVISLANELKAMRLKASRAEELYNAFWTRHAAVRPHGDDASPSWIKLQALDAQIALKVLCYLAELNIPAVPVHDSFVIPAKYEAQCKKAMQKSFADYAPGIPVMIKSTAENKPA